MISHISGVSCRGQSPLKYKKDWERLADNPYNSVWKIGLVALVFYSIQAGNHFFQKKIVFLLEKRKYKYTWYFVIQNKERL